MTNVAELSINTLPYPTGPAPETAVLNQVLEELQSLQEQVQILQDENVELRARVNALESAQEQSHETLALDIAKDRQRISRLETNEPLQSQGKKTLARQDKLKTILKSCGGSRTFQQLKKDLGLSPSQFSKLVGTLDKRCYEVSRRENSKHGEKVLKLRVRILDSI
jgi:hypothetical protein